MKELRENQSQVHHSLNDAVEELRDRHAQLNLVQNNEKRRVSWLTSRMDQVEDKLETFGEAIKSSDEKAQGRFDSLKTMIQQVLLNTDKSKPAEDKPRDSAEAEAMDYSFNHPVQRNVSSILILLLLLQHLIRLELRLNRIILQKNRHLTQ